MSDRQYNMNIPYQGPDRRINSSMELQQSILKLVSKVETMETNIEAKLDTHAQINSAKLELMSGKLEVLEGKLEYNISTLRDRLKEHVEEDKDVDTMLHIHDKAIEKAEDYVGRIHKLEENYTNLAKRVTKIELTPAIEALESKKDTRKQVKSNILTFLLGGGVIGVILAIIQLLVVP